MPCKHRSHLLRKDHERLCFLNQLCDLAFRAEESDAACKIKMDAMIKDSMIKFGACEERVKATKLNPKTKVQAHTQAQPLCTNKTRENGSGNMVAAIAGGNSRAESAHVSKASQDLPSKKAQDGAGVEKKDKDTSKKKGWFLPDLLKGMRGKECGNDGETRRVPVSAARECTSDGIGSEALSAAFLALSFPSASTSI